MAIIRRRVVSHRHQRRRPRALADWELAKLLAALDELDAERGPRGPRIPQAIIVRVLFETGARWGELTLATWGDLDLAGATLTFRAETTKTDRERAIPLLPETAHELGQILPLVVSGHDDERLGRHSCWAGS